MKYTKALLIFICYVFILSGCTNIKGANQVSSIVPGVTSSSDNSIGEALKEPDITAAEGPKSTVESASESPNESNNTAKAQSGTNSSNTAPNKEGTGTGNNVQNPDVNTSTDNVQFPDNSQPLSVELDEKLMKQGEHLIYFFQEEDSENCMSISTDESETYLIYRFGTKDKLDLEYPSSTADSWDSFTYMYYFRGGGEENSGLDLNYLQFDIGSYKYIIYDEYLSEADSKDAGIMIYDMTTPRPSDDTEDRYMDFEPEYKLTVIKGSSDSIEGGLALLRGNDKIKTEIL